MEIANLVGYNQNEAVKCRNAYTVYVNELQFAEDAVSRLDVGIIVNRYEVQLNQALTKEEKEMLEDIFYDTYMEYRNKKWYFKKETQTLGYSCLQKLNKTDDWLPVNTRAMCFEMFIRCLAYHFKTSNKVKRFIKTIPYRPVFLKDHWSV